MTRARPVIRVSLLVFAICGLSAAPILAQLIPPYLSMSTRADATINTCLNTPPPCSGPAWDKDLGPHEFDVFRVVQWFPIEATDFRLAWPADWILLDWEICYGVLESGDPGTPDSQLRFTFPQCPIDDGPFLRMRFDCTVPGRFGFNGGALAWECGGYETVEVYDPHCDIGEFCGMQHDTPCDPCGSREDAGNFRPTSLALTLNPGDVYRETLEVVGDRGPDCGGLPECGGGGNGRCLGSLSGDQPWILAYLEDPGGEGYGPHDYDIVIDARQLHPGVHHGRVYAEPGGCSCDRSCMPVTLTVREPASAEAADAAKSILGLPAPNPTTGRVRCSISLEKERAARIDLVNVAGQVIAHLSDEVRPAGVSSLGWDLDAEAGGRLPGGVYFLRLAAGASSRSESRIIILDR